MTKIIVGYALNVSMRETYVVCNAYMLWLPGYEYADSCSAKGAYVAV